MHEWLKCVCIQNLNWNCHHHHISASSSSSCNGIISSFRIMMMLSTAHQLSLAASKTLKDKCFRERETKESLIKTIVIAIFYINLWGGEKPSSPIVGVLTTWLLRMECHPDHVGDDDDDKDDWWWWQGWLMMMMTSVWFEKYFVLPCGDHQDPSIQAPRKSPEQRFSLQYF